MQRAFWLMTAVAWAACTPRVWGQFADDPPPETPHATIAVQRWRIGMLITAEGGAFKKIVGTVSVPMDWPEQQVRIVEQDLSPGVAVSYQTVENTARQMVIRIPALAAGQQAKALVTFEVRRTLARPPEQTEQFVLANPNRLGRKLLGYLAPSPYIESTHPEIKQAAQTIGQDGQTAWEQVEAIYDWVRQKVQYRNEPLKGALAALRDGTGDCDELTSLFIALCRAKGIPARTVRVPGHCYPEFYLLDAENRGHWFPCQAAGTRAFGAMPDPRPILQKGDNVPGVDPRTHRKLKYRFLPENLIGLPVGPAGSLKLQLVCEKVHQQ